MLHQKLEDGQAHVWYLGHSGWAIKTKSRLLIFDYWEHLSSAPPGVKFEKPTDASLSNGYVIPEEIKDIPLYVFVSHEHSDHFDPAILEWEKSVENITYLFGWVNNNGPDDVYFNGKRESMQFEGMTVSTIGHAFDRIPEVAYLIKVDGLTIYYAGDHGSSSNPPNPVFVDNIDYLATQIERLDMAFLPTFGGGFYTIEMLRPAVTFPMHDGGREHQYKIFAQKAEQRKASTRVGVAEKRGDHFFYDNGRLDASK